MIEEESFILSTVRGQWVSIVEVTFNVSVELKMQLKYCKYRKIDRLKFHTHDEPWDVKAMTAILQLHFQWDADLGTQTSYIGYLKTFVICWCSTDGGSVSTSTAESDIKAVNHTLKAEVISKPGKLDAIGWKQKPASAL